MKPADGVYILLGGDLTITDNSETKAGKILAEKERFSAESVYDNELGWTAAPTVIIDGGTVEILTLAENAKVKVNAGDVKLAVYDEDYYAEWDGCMSMKKESLLIKVKFQDGWK